MGFRNLEGTNLGQYQLEKLLGKGGMGVVYRALQPRLNRYVAVKILSDSQAKRSEQIKRFHREAETSAALEHPHIVPVYDYGTEDEMNFVVMRLLTGGSLSEHIERVVSGQEKRASLQDIAQLLKQIAGALDYAHERGIIHRDVKPSNVMFDDYGNAFLVDFGLVKLLDNSKSNLTNAGIILGTPAYMAPEQWRDEALTPAIDQYALGALIYLLLSGRLPFNSDTSPYELMQQHCEAPVPDVHNFQRDIPPKISAVIQRAMAKNAEDRFPVVMDFANAFLEASMHQHSTNAAANMFQTHGDTMRPEEFQAPHGVLRIEQSRDSSMIGKEVAIEKSPFTVGRLSRDLNFDGDRNVSRNHCHITQDDNGDFYAIDQNSTLKTVVEGVELQPFEPHKLKNHADIRLGTTTVLTLIIYS